MRKPLFISTAVILLFSFVSLFTLESFRKTPKAKEPVFIGEFVYSVPLDKHRVFDKAAPDWYHEFIEPRLNDSLMNPIMTGVIEKKISVRSPKYLFTEVLNADSASQSIQFTYINEWNDYDDYTGVETFRSDTEYYACSAYDVVGITFHEDWYYDQASSTLIKKVKGILPLFLDESRDVVEAKFYVPFSDGAVTKRDAGVTGITYDFDLGPQKIDNDGAYAMFGASDAFQIKQVAAWVSFMTTVKQSCHDKNATLCFPAFPQEQVMDATTQNAVLSYVDGAKEIRFKEDWIADYTNMRFAKYVRGVTFGQKTKIMVNIGTDFDSNMVEREFMLAHAFVPMNRSLQKPVLPTAFVADRIAYGAVYNYGKSNVNYPRFETADSLKLVSVLQNIFENARDGKRKIYADTATHFYFDAWQTELFGLTEAQRKEIFWPHQSGYNELDNYYSMRNIDTVPFSKFCGFRFYESWYFDPVNSTFRKNIQGIGATRYGRRPGDEEHYEDKVAVSFGYVNPTDPLDSIRQPKYLVAKNVITPVQINAEESIAMWGNYGSFFEYIYSPQYRENLEFYQRYQLVESVLRNVQAGKMTAWSPSEKNKAFSLPEFNAMLDTVMSDYELARPNLFMAFDELAFDEDWYFNPRTGQIYKHVNAITFGRRLYMQNEYDLNREFEGAPFLTGLRYFTIKVNQQ